MEGNALVHRRLLKGFQIMNEIEPGTCPNFYLWGESVSKLEADAKELTAMMEMDKVCLLYTSADLIILTIQKIWR